MSAFNMYDDDGTGCDPSLLSTGGVFRTSHGAQGASGSPVLKPEKPLTADSPKGMPALPASFFPSFALKPKIEIAHAPHRPAVKPVFEPTSDVRSVTTVTVIRPPAPKFTSNFEPPVLEASQKLNSTTIFFSRFPGCKEHEVCQALVDHLQEQYAGVDFLKADAGMVLSVSVFGKQNQCLTSFELGVYSLMDQKLGLTDAFALEFVPQCSGSNFSEFSELFSDVKDLYCAKFSPSYSAKIPARYGAIIEEEEDDAASTCCASATVSHRSSSDDEDNLPSMPLPALASLDLDGDLFSDLETPQRSAEEIQEEKECLVFQMRSRLNEGPGMQAMVEIAECLKDEVKIADLGTNEHALMQVAEIVEFLLEETSHSAVLFPLLCFLLEHKELTPPHLLEPVKEIVNNRQAYGGLLRMKAKEILA